MPSSAAGRLLHAFSSILSSQPATKPASRAPRKPEGIAEATPAFTASSPVRAAGFANVLPEAASIPPTIPTSKPGRSAIDIAIKPAKIGSIKPNATPPMFLNHADTGVPVPKPSSCGTPAKESIRNAMAIKIPPATTNGSMCDTPFIRCLYSFLPKLSSSAEALVSLAFLSEWKIPTSPFTILLISSSGL